MENLSIIALAIVVLIAAVTPGPGMTAIVARGLSVGLVPTLPMVAGMVFSHILFLIAASTGLAAIAHTFSIAIMVLTYAGAAYLLFSAWRLWTVSPQSLGLGLARGGKPWRTFLFGLTFTLGNPKTIVFYLALLPTMIDFETLSIADFFTIASLVAGIRCAVGIAYAAAASQARTLFVNPKAHWILNRTSGTMLAVVALAVVAH
jgi:threonine/homoserine/homoserine lactone efflux protein